MFNFGYAVKDAAQGDDFSHQVSSDGANTTGEYRVALPDGRVQVSQSENFFCYCFHSLLLFIYTYFR